jgi:neutral amino acid transport system substrate-binding protein
MNKPRLVVCAVVACLLAAGCSSSGSGSKSSGGTTGPILVGAEVSLTGSLAEFSGGVLQGIQAGVKVVNDAGGVMGRPLKLVTGDDASDPVDAVPTARKILSQHVVAVLGAPDGLLKAEEPIWTAAKIPMLTPGGDTEWDKNTNPYIWRVTPSDSQLGVAMAVYAHNAGYKRAALLFDTGPSAQGLKPVVKNAWTKTGGTFVADVNVQTNQTSYRSEAQRIIDSHADVILAEIPPDSAGVFFANLRSLGALNIPIVGTDETVSSQFVKAIGNQAAQSVLTSVEGTQFSSPAATQFLAAVNAIAPGQQPQANANYGYDSVMLLALAMEQAHSVKGTDVNAQINSIGNGPGTTVYSFADGQKAIAAGKKVVYVGASGPFQFDANRNVFGPFAAVRLNAGGKYDTLKVLTADELQAASK